MLNIYETKWGYYFIHCLRYIENHAEAHVDEITIFDFMLCYLNDSVFNL